jgi:serine/threonine protein phosphatase PrpC
MTIANSNSPQRACDFLISLTLDRGATDNVTTVMVRFDNAAPGAPRPIQSSNGG